MAHTVALHVKESKAQFLTLSHSFNWSAILLPEIFLCTYPKHMEINVLSKWGRVIRLLVCKYSKLLDKGKYVLVRIIDENGRKREV